MKIKKVTFAAIHAGVVSGAGNTFELELTPDIVLRGVKTLSMQDAVAFVNDVVGICMNEETGEYMPEVKEFAIRLVTLIRYGGLPTPKDMSKAYAVAMCADVYDRVARAINGDQHFELMEAINEKIDLIVKMQQSAAVNRVNQLIEAMESMMADGSAMVETLSSNETLDALKSLGEKLQAVDLAETNATAEE